MTTNFLVLWICEVELWELFGMTHLLLCFLCGKNFPLKLSSTLAAHIRTMGQKIRKCSLCIRYSQILGPLAANFIALWVVHMGAIWNDNNYVCMQVSWWTLVWLCKVNSVQEACGSLIKIWKFEILQTTWKKNQKKTSKC